PPPMMTTWSAEEETAIPHSPPFTRQFVRIGIYYILFGWFVEHHPGKNGVVFFIHTGIYAYTISSQTSNRTDSRRQKHHVPQRALQPRTLPYRKADRNHTCYDRRTALNHDS